MQLLITFLRCATGSYYASLNEILMSGKLTGTALSSSVCMMSWSGRGVAICDIYPAKSNRIVSIMNA